MQKIYDNNVTSYKAGHMQLVLVNWKAHENAPATYKKHEHITKNCRFYTRIDCFFCMDLFRARYFLLPTITTIIFFWYNLQQSMINDSIALQEINHLPMPVNQSRKRERLLLPVHCTFYLNIIHAIVFFVAIRREWIMFKLNSTLKASHKMHLKRRLCCLKPFNLIA